MIFSYTKQITTGKLLIILFFAAIFTVNSQTKTVENALKTERKKIGLVLSGGGARCLSQIGILKVLEQNNIKIDYITGTSMGAVIGALYASGYSADEIQNKLLSKDIASMLNNDSSRYDLEVMQKDSLERSAIHFEIKDFALKMPQGFIFGQKQYNFLSDILWHVKDTKDFNKLKIPFRCAALDIENGNSEILSSGDLVDSIRASMAFPSIFSPVEIDGKLLVDGGVKLNFPVMECRKMGADIVIAVDTRTYMLKKDKLDTFTAIANQSIKILMDTNVKKQIEAADIIMRPKLNKYETMGFDNNFEIVEAGKTEALIVGLTKPMS